MNREDIIRMAQEAGVPMEYSFVADSTVWHLHPSFERFANLVAAAVKAEDREACAKICQAEGDEWYNAWNNWHMYDDTGREKILGMSDGAAICAELIRARGDK